MGLNKLFYSEVFLIIENGHFEAVCTKDMLLNKKCFYLPFCSRLQYFNPCGSLSYTSYLNFVGFINRQQIFVQNYQTSPTTLLFRIHNRSDKEVKKTENLILYSTYIYNIETLVSPPFFSINTVLSKAVRLYLCTQLQLNKCFVIRI